MADLHGQPLVTEIGATDRIAAGIPGQTGASNILRDDLRVQFTAPAVGVTFNGTDIDLSNLRGTYYDAFSQSANVTFSFTAVPAINGAAAFIRINSNGSNTFTFTAAEAFGVTSGETLPAGNHIFRFLQTPYGVSVSVFRDTSGPVQSVNSNGLTLFNGELFNGGDVTANLGWTLVSGNWRVANGSGNTAYQISPTLGVTWQVLQSNGSDGLLLFLNTASNGSIQLGYTNDASTLVRGIDINNTRMTLNGFTFPETDGTAGQALVTNGSNVLSFATISGGGGITNGAADGELPVSDGTNLLGSGIHVNTLSTEIEAESRDRDFEISAGSSLSATARNIRIFTVATSSLNDSGNITIETLNVSGAGNQSGDVIIQTGTGSLGATRGNISIGGLNYPLVDGTSGQVIGTNGANVLSFVDPLALGTPAERITALTSTGGALNIDFNGLSRFREFSLSLMQDTTLSFANATNRSGFRIYLNVVGGVRTITLPTTVLMPSDTSNITGVTYNNTAQTLQLAAGMYELKNDFDGINDYFAITSNYI